MPTVKVQLDHLPEDAEVEVPYLGLFQNGTTTEVDQDRWDRFVQLQPGAEQYEDEDHLELTTAAAQERSEAYAQVTAAVEGEEKSLRDYKKSELQDMARELGIENHEELLKDQLVAAIEAKSSGRPESVVKDQDNTEGGQ